MDDSRDGYDAGATSLLTAPLRSASGGITLSSAAMSHGAMLAFWFATTISGTAAVYADFTSPTQFTPDHSCRSRGVSERGDCRHRTRDGWQWRRSPTRPVPRHRHRYLTVTDRDSLDMAAADSFTLAMMMRTSLHPWIRVGDGKTGRRWPADMRSTHHRG